MSCNPKILIGSLRLLLKHGTLCPVFFKYSYNYMSYFNFVLLAAILSDQLIPILRRYACNVHTYLPEASIYENDWGP